MDAESKSLNAETPKRGNEHAAFVEIIGYDHPRPKWWVRICVGVMHLTGPETDDYFKAKRGADKLAAALKLEVKLRGNR